MQHWFEVMRDCGDDVRDAKAHASTSRRSRSRSRNTFLLGDVTGAYDVGGVALTATTSPTTRDVQVVRDAPATAATGLTQELRVAGDHARVAWLLGTVRCRCCFGGPVH